MRILLFLFLTIHLVSCKPDVQVEYKTLIHFKNEYGQTLAKYNGEIFPVQIDGNKERYIQPKINHVIYLKTK